MNTDRESYKKYAAARAKKSPILKNCVCAFLVGGGICSAAQGLRTLYQSWGASEENSGTLVSVTLIFITALLTGLVVLLNVLGITSVCIAAAALSAYIPLLLILFVVWYIVGHIL